VPAIRRARSSRTRANHLTLAIASAVRLVIDPPRCNIYTAFSFQATASSILPNCPLRLLSYPFPSRRKHYPSPNKPPLRRPSIFRCCQKLDSDQPQIDSQIFSEPRAFPCSALQGIAGSGTLPLHARPPHTQPATRVVHPILALAKLTIDVLTTVRLC
jgi:hypothetical protein